MLVKSNSDSVSVTHTFAQNTYPK